MAEFLDSEGNTNPLIDGDTYYHPIKGRVRIAGFSTRETPKLIVNDDGEKEIKKGQVGGDAQKIAIARLIKEGGFNIPTYLGKVDRSDGKREVAHLRNARGDRLEDYVIGLGIADPDEFTSKEASLMKENFAMMKVMGKKLPFQDIVDDTRKQLDTGIYFKTPAITEDGYDPRYNSGVMFRDPRKTLDNKATSRLGQAGASWRTGWNGVKEGIWGYIDAIGQVSGIEALESIGEAGVRRARDRILQEPEVILNYKDVDGVMDAFSYVLNNAATSAPYMISTISAIAASVPATFVGGPIAGAAVGYVPISMIYAGHTWNEMEGAKGLPQFLAASNAGVASSVLERAGLRGLMSPKGFLSEGGISKASKLYAKRHNVSEPFARNLIMTATRQEQAKYLKGLIKLTPDDIKRFSALQLGGRVARGIARESLTEVGQEAIQATTAGLASDKDYTTEELLDRFINAGLAGGVLGGTLAGAGGIYEQGRDRLRATDFQQYKSNRLLAIEQKKIEDLKRNGKIKTVEEVINDSDGDTNKRYRNLGIDFTINGKKFTFETDKGKANTNAESDTTVFIDPEFKKEINKDDKIEILEDKIIVTKPDGTQKEYPVSFVPTENSYPLDIKDGRVFFSGNNIDKGSVKQNPNTATEIKFNEGKEAVIFSNAAQRFENKFRGLGNIFRNQTGLFSLADKAVTGFRRFFSGMEVDIATEQDLMDIPELRELNALVGQTNNGVYHSGRNHKSYQDKVLEDIKSVVDENNIAKIFANQVGRFYQKNVTMTSDNAKYISTQLQAFGAAEGFKLVEQFTNGEITLIQVKDALVKNGFDPNIMFDEQLLAKLTDAALSIRTSYKLSYDAIAEEWNKENKQDPFPPFDETYWYSNEGFDWYEATKDPKGFKDWLINSAGLSSEMANDQFENVAFRGTHRARSSFSLVEGKVYKPFSFSEKAVKISGIKGYKKWSSGNIFEALNRVQVEAAKYHATTRYFGQGGRKLNERFYDIKRKYVDTGLLSEERFGQAAYYVKAIIDSTHGNYKRIENPRWAGMNRFLTNWSIFAGLSLSALSSIPETAMIYFNLKDDHEWKQANSALVNQLVALWKGTMSEEFQQAERYLKRSGIAYDANTVVDRLATGERDMAYVKAHEVFFRTILIKQWTQMQRRMASSLGMDFIKSGFNILSTAPRILTTLPDGKEGGFKGFDFDNFNEYEMRTYTQLSDLSINVELIMNYYYQLDELKRDKIFNLSDDNYKTIIDESDSLGVKVEIEGINQDEFIYEPDEVQVLFKQLAENEVETQSDKEVYKKALDIQAEIEEEITNGIYKFVNERIQNPQAANRPEFFQNPHYQLLTQFNGFLSTFTANIVPKLWNRQLRKGNPQVKYDTFALILVLLALGGASQWLKDLIKFGRPSPYLDAMGYTQRALYSSGVIGQYERLVDIAKPLYPSRDDWLGSIIFGELGPSIRNIGAVAKGAGLLAEGEGERAIKSFAKTMPYGGPIPSVRQAAADVGTLKNPFDRVDLPNTNEIIDSLLS